MSHLRLGSRAHARFDRVGIEATAPVECLDRRVDALPDGELIDDP